MTTEPVHGPVAGITIRPAVRDDAPAIWEMIADLASTLETPEMHLSRAEDMLRHGFDSEPQFEALLAEQGGAVAGLVLYFYVFSSWRGELGIYVQDIHVLQRFRGLGLGRVLLVAAARKGRSDGCTHLRLSVHPDNVSACQFYERMGLGRRDDEVIYQAADEAFEQLLEDTS